MRHGLPECVTRGECVAKPGCLTRCATYLGCLTRRATNPGCLTRCATNLGCLTRRATNPGCLTRCATNPPNLACKTPPRTLLPLSHLVHWGGTLAACPTG